MAIAITALTPLAASAASSLGSALKGVETGFASVLHAVIGGDQQKTVETDSSKQEIESARLRDEILDELSELYAAAGAMEGDSVVVRCDALTGEISVGSGPRGAAVEDALELDPELMEKIQQLAISQSEGGRADDELELLVNAAAT